MNHEGAYHHANEAKSLASSPNDREVTQAQVHALLAIHYDLQLLIHLQHG